MATKTYNARTLLVAAKPRNKRLREIGYQGGSSATVDVDLTPYLLKATFDDLFEKVNIGTEEAPKWSIKAKYGLWTEQFLSAKGVEDGETQGGIDYEAVQEMIAEALAGYNPSTGSIDWDSITGKPDVFAPSAHTHTWDSITGKPTTFAPSAHNHTKSDITDFAHGHGIADVTGLQDALDGKVPTTRTITAGTGLAGGGTLAADRTISLNATNVGLLQMLSDMFEWQTVNGVQTIKAKASLWTEGYLSAKGVEGEQSGGSALDDVWSEIDALGRWRDTATQSIDELGGKYEAASGEMEVFKRRDFAILDHGVLKIVHTDAHGTQSMESVGAGNVGARPSTWTPTASDVGVPAWAQSDTKPTYNAAEVGARPNTWTPTASDVGADPAGAAASAASAAETAAKNYADGLLQIGNGSNGGKLATLKIQLNGSDVDTYSPLATSSKTINVAGVLTTGNYGSYVTKSYIELLNAGRFDFAYDNNTRIEDWVKATAATRKAGNVFSVNGWAWAQSKTLKLTDAWSIDRMRYSAISVRDGDLTSTWNQQAILFVPTYSDVSNIYLAQMATGGTAGEVATAVKRYADYDTIMADVGNAYLPLTGGTLTGRVKLNASGNGALVELNNTDSEPHFYLQRNGVSKTAFTHHSTYGSSIYSAPAAKYMGITDAGVPHFQGSTLLHAGNINTYQAFKLLTTDSWDNQAGIGKILIGGVNIFGDGVTRWGSILQMASTPENTPSTSNNANWYWQLYGETNGTLYHRHRTNGAAWSGWKAILNSDNYSSYITKSYVDGLGVNAATTTKLQTSRTIWGQSFNGTANVDGVFRSLTDASDGQVLHSILKYPTSPYGLLTRIYDSGMVSLQSQRETTTSEYFGLSLNPLGGNVGIGTTSPAYKLHVVGSSGDLLRLDSSGTYSCVGFCCKANATDASADFRASAGANGTDYYIWSNSRYQLQMNLTSGQIKTQAGIHIGRTGFANSFDEGIRIAGESNQHCTIAMGTSASAYSGATSTTWWLSKTNVDTFRLGRGTNSASGFLEILNSGNVGIGTTSPDAKLHVAGAVHATVGVRSDGYLSGKATTSSSDMRLKDVQGACDLTTEQVAAAPSFLFRYKADPSMLYVGSSAQYWQDALPESVLEIGGTLHLDYAKLATASVIAVARRELELERRVQELEDEVKRLRRSA